MKIRKRNGLLVEFDSSKIENAIRKAMNEVGEFKDESLDLCEDIAKSVAEKCYDGIGVENIQDLVVTSLFSNGLNSVGLAYQTYRTLREHDRTAYHDLMKVVDGIYYVGSDDNSNKPSHLRNVKRDMTAGEIEKIQASRHIPKRIWEAHCKKEIYWHDLDFSGDIPMTNCCIPNVWDMLDNGTRINNADITTPKSIGVATTVLAQIVANIAHQQYGGISISDFNEQLAKYATMSLNKNFKYNCDYEGIEFFEVCGDSKNIPNTHKKAYDMAKEKTKKDIYDACQSYEYEANSISSASQTPFSTLSLNIPTSWESKEIAKAYLKVRMAKLGKKIAIFPKINYVVVDGYNLKKGDPHYDLTELAVKCISQCFYPDILNYTREEYEKGQIFSRMGE